MCVCVCAHAFDELGQPMAHESHPGVLSHCCPQSRQTGRVEKRKLSRRENIVGYFSIHKIQTYPYPGRRLEPENRSNTTLKIPFRCYCLP